MFSAFCVRSQNTVGFSVIVNVSEEDTAGSSSELGISKHM